MLQVTVLEGMVPTGKLVVIMGYSYWQFIGGIPKVDGIKEEEFMGSYPKA